MLHAGCTPKVSPVHIPGGLRKEEIHIQKYKYRTQSTHTNHHPSPIISIGMFFCNLKAAVVRALGCYWKPNSHCTLGRQVARLAAWLADPA